MPSRLLENVAHHWMPPRWSNMTVYIQHTLTHICIIIIIIISISIIIICITIIIINTIIIITIVYLLLIR